MIILIANLPSAAPTKSNFLARCNVQGQIFYSKVAVVRGLPTACLAGRVFGGTRLT